MGDQAARAGGAGERRAGQELHEYVPARGSRHAGAQPGRIDSAATVPYERPVRERSRESGAVAQITGAGADAKERRRDRRIVPDIPLAAAVRWRDGGRRGVSRQGSVARRRGGRPGLDVHQQGGVPVQLLSRASDGAVLRPPQSHEDNMKDRFGFECSQGAPYWSRPQMGRRLFFRHIASAVGGYMLLPGRPAETVAKAAVITKSTAKNCIF